MDCEVAKKLNVRNPDTTSMVSTLRTEELAPWLLKQKRPEALSPEPVRQLTSHPKDPHLRGKKSKTVTVMTRFGCEKQWPKITRFQHSQPLSLFHIKAGKLASQAWCGCIAV